MTIALSFGGGVQSVALCVLVGEGTLPRPDLAGIADTGREKRTTWDYLHNVMQPYLERKGVPLRIEVIPHSLARVDLYAKTSDKPLVPAWTRTTRTEEGLFGPVQVHEDGRLPGYCSGEWKRDVFERWLRSKGVRECDTWIGYSLDEKWRVKADHRPWCRYRHPLIDLGLTRDVCLRLIEAAGLPPPHKSRCYDCPHQSPAEWAEVKANPVEWAAAVERDHAIREADDRHGLYLYSGRVPLELADLTKDDRTPGRPCEGGHCWT